MFTAAVIHVSASAGTRWYRDYVTPAAPTSGPVEHSATTRRIDLLLSLRQVTAARRHLAGQGTE